MASAAYVGLVKLHALELIQRAAFRKTGRIAVSHIRSISTDLAALNESHSLDETIGAILACADALELAREAAEKNTDDDGGAQITEAAP